MTTRSAVSTLRGYFYQFDLSILKILELKSVSDSVDLECIEDIDINTASETTSIQCKYYEGTDFKVSIIAHPIRLMFRHFMSCKSAGSASPKFHIYGHYRSNISVFPTAITLDFAKNSLLTYTHDGDRHILHSELSATDPDIVEFISLLTINLNAEKYESQLSTVYSTLSSELGCSKEDAEEYYYNNSLAVIKSIVEKPNPLDRRISKQNFIAAINCKNLLFSRWFTEFKGKAAYIGMIRNKYLKQVLNLSPFERIFMIECTGATRADLVAISLSIQKRWSRLSNRDSSSFCPYIYLHALPPLELSELKEILYNQNLRCIDGYDYENAKFSATSLTKQATFANGIALKFINKLSDLDAAIIHMPRKVEIYQFYFDKQFYLNDSIEVTAISIDSILTTKEVLK